MPVRGVKKMTREEKASFPHAGALAAEDVARSGPAASETEPPELASQQPSGGANMGEFDEKGYYGEKEAANAPSKQGSSMPDGSGVRTTEKFVESVKETLSESWETLKHGVNNAGQPQMKKEEDRLRKGE
ncbi:MAG: hypothetical protein WDW38_005683 [Sanguina aurantia]